MKPISTLRTRLRSIDMTTGESAGGAVLPVGIEDDIYNGLADCDDPVCLGTAGCGDWHPITNDG